VIERAQADGWELVRCDVFGTVFLKPLPEPRQCRGLPAIPDHYATLELQFEQGQLRRGNAGRREAAAFTFAFEMPARRTELPASVARRFSIGDAADRITYATSPLSGMTAFYFLDRAADTLIVMHDPNAPGGCSRNAFGMILGDGTRATVDMPSQDYTRMREELAKAIRYTGEAD
jgi:hypothetical protein